MRKIKAIVIAERTLTCAEYPERKVVVKLAKPELNPEAEDYDCAYQIIGPGINVTRFATGLDSVQALQLALVAIGAELVHIEQTAGLHLKFANRDFGFPRP